MCVALIRAEGPPAQKEFSLGEEVIVSISEILPPVKVAEEAQAVKVMKLQPGKPQVVEADNGAASSSI
eukprot:12925975-Prorocentrum_lima.AAC.1